MLRIFTPVKIQGLRPGFNPQTWVPEASMLTTIPPKPSTCIQSPTFLTIILSSKILKKIQQPIWRDITDLLLLSVGFPVANAPDVLQPCGLSYYP